MGVDENADGCGRGANGGSAPKVGRAGGGGDTAYAEDEYSAVIHMYDYLPVQHPGLEIDPQTCQSHHRL